MIDAGMTADSAGGGPVTVKVITFSDAGSNLEPEGRLKVALMVALGQTAFALAAGLVEITEMFAGAVGPAVMKLQT